MTARALFQFYKVKLLNYGVLIVSLEQVSHVVTVLLLLTLNKSAPTGTVPLGFSN